MIMPQLVRIDRQLAPIPRRTAKTITRAWRTARRGAMLRIVTIDARKDGVRAVRRLVRRTRNRTEDLLSETAHRVKRRPFRAVGIALGVGSAIGLTAGWLGHRH
jgi:ElaB/YqjD/DUF883 family membrane-anchored ribosome-binding protein